MFSSRVQGGGSRGSDVRLVDKGKYVRARESVSCQGYLTTYRLLLQIVLDNGIVRITLTSPGGLITSISYGGIDNLLEVANAETNRGYWDLNWNVPGGKDTFDVHHATSFRVISSDGNKIEVSFLRPYVSDRSMVPLQIDKRFVLLRGNTGFYSYAIFERPEGWPDFNMNQCRITFKPRSDRFEYMAVSDTVFRQMPTSSDRSPERSKALAYPEAVILEDPHNSALKGEVDDKYQYSAENKDNVVHGWVSTNPLVGFWIITASDEFRNGGPLKQNLRSHAGPTALSMFHSAHYAGEALCPSFRDGEPWLKVFGPVFIYLNSAQANLDPRYLWDDAKQQMLVEAHSWPYSWPASPDYVKDDERGSVSGRLLVYDKYADPQVPASLAWIGLAKPGNAGSWQTESKGYQFWAEADASGSFMIHNVIPGTYNLFGYVPGVLGDYKMEADVTVHEGSSLELGELVFNPPRNGPTIWEIGVPDRSAVEFYIPDPDPGFVNRAFVNSTADRHAQYGLWERYFELYPETEVVYTVGESKWQTDWFFLQGCWKSKDGNLKASTWKIKFQLDKVALVGTYTLQLAIAAATNAALQVRVNDPTLYTPHFDTLQFGKDNAIARHGIHGLYAMWSIDVESKLLKEGENIIYLTQRKYASVFNGVMYDYLRLEAPPL
ncbi:hypothetical protein SELMODRAFT_137340 [Selaginella moellendorffii]|uniref:rhamnogalacturonan endolyase n=1 Tax=Selaginella moellendorffii TaxID=88036 RepID=D8TDG4_SELML|nr:hypothetical protein SELMODRAFT_137340 [Selaginella moellendorffii]